MKLLTFAVPCYNSEAYMENCIRSLLPGGEDVEIIIVDDGSKAWNSGHCRPLCSRVSDNYQSRTPGKWRTWRGSQRRTPECPAGIYYKVVDSDDWVDENAYKEVLATLRRFVYGNQTLDMLICNFVYEKQGAKHKKVMNYHTALPKDQIFTWKDVKVFMLGQYILMHSVIYRTELLRQCNFELPKHTFLCG